MKTNGYRKVFLGLVYLVGICGVTALEIYKHTPPDLTGMALLAAGVATGLGTVIWGNAKEHEHSAKQ